MHSPRPVSPNELRRRVWGDDVIIDTANVRIAIASLRAKAGRSAIVTRHGLGYVWTGLEEGVDDDDGSQSIHHLLSTIHHPLSTIHYSLPPLEEGVDDDEDSQ